MVNGLWFVAFTAFFLFTINYLPSTIYAHSEAHQILATQNGFEPDEIEIDLGDTVIFINQDQKDRWPASNIHPTHVIYPGFDSKKEVKPNEIWQFKFEEPGNFKFHDHLIPQFTGTIEVKGEKTKKTAFSINLALFAKKFYYFLFPASLNQELNKTDFVKIGSDEKKVEEWVFMVGGEKFMQELVLDSEGGSKIDCHQEAHFVGRIAYKFEAKKVFKKPNYNCHSGFLHGAMEAFIAENKGQNLVDQVYKLCQNFETQFGKFECLHGIGHGFLAYEDYDLPEALKLCQNLPSDYSKDTCLGGLFMENIMVASGKGAVSGHATNWVSNDPYFPCNGIDKSYQIQFQCYQMQTSRMIQLSNYDFNFISQACQGAPKNMISVCFTSMGRDLAGYVLRDHQKIVDHCNRIPKEYFRDCLRGALNVIIDFWGENLVDQPQQLCKILEGSEKEYCYTWFATRLKDVFLPNTAKIKDACGYVEDQFKENCLAIIKN